MNNASSVSATELARLHACPPIADLSPEARERVLAAVSVSRVADGTAIVTQGSVGDAFFVLLDGRVEVLKEDNGKLIDLSELDAGAYFGEQALLGKKSGLRAATVRAKGDCRVASITADVFNQVIAALGQNRDRFENDAARYVYREISKSLDAFAASELVDGSAGVERRAFGPGEILVSEGDTTNTVFLILSGHAVVYKNFQGRRREVARLGVGQVFGELAVLMDEPRAATVISASEMEVLQIAADAFVRWHRAHPDTAAFFSALSNVYKLSQGRQMSVYLGEVSGAKAVTAVVGRPGDGVVSTRLLDEDVVVFINGAANALAGERATITYADERIKRELRVIVRERRGDKIDSCVVYGVAAEGIENDLGTLYQHVLDLDVATPAELRRFERTGFLGGSAEKSERLCPCLGLGPAEITEAVQELGNDYATLQANIGVGRICGGCERAVCGFLAQCAVPAGAQAGAHALPLPARGRDDAPLVADVPPDLLTRDEKQLAALIARGMGSEHRAVAREQLAVRLRATGVRDMNFFIDMLFPGVFTKYPRATYATLAAAVGRGIGFGKWRDDALQPVPWHKALARRFVQRVYRLGRFRVLGILAAAATLHALVHPASALPVWGGLLAAFAALLAILSLTPSGRFLRVFLLGGPSRFYRALWTAFGAETSFATLRINPFGKPVYIVRDERLVDYILQRPDIYARSAVVGYPAFAEHSVLGGGSSGVWLGYRMLCEEYFAERYREDLDEMRAIVRERIALWEGRDGIDLLREIYRIVIEIHGRVFFQTSFGCFDDNAETDFADLIDRTLMPGVLLFNDPLDGDVARLRRFCTDAVRNATRKDSIGGILRAAWEAGDINEREACENAVMYMLAQAPTMGSFWTLYRSARNGTQDSLRASRREIVKAIKEELRLHAPVATMFTRGILRDDTLGGKPVEAGATIIMCPMYIHTNPRQWTHAETHDTQRWSAPVGDGKEIVEPKTDASDSTSRPQPLPEGAHGARYVPYGGGGQACQGRWYASDEMLVVVEEILAHCELQVIDDRGLLDRPLHDQVQFHVYNRPWNDVRMKVVRRR